MRVAFLAPELARWDAAAADGLVAWVFSDERPPRGAAGLLDWRLCGRVSRWILGGRLSAAPGEALLFPPGNGLPFRAALLLGGGALDRFDERAYVAAIREGYGRARRAGLKRFAIGLPGRAPGRERLGPRRAIELLLDEHGGDDADVFVIEPPAAQKEMSEVVRMRRFATFAPGRE